MQDEWAEAFGTMTYGIYVLTTFHDDEINCMIASCSGVSLWLIARSASPNTK